MQRLSSGLGGIGLTVLLATGCSAGSPVDAAEEPELAGTSWVVRRIDEGSGRLAMLPDEAAATLEFALVGTLAGTTSCNRYSAPYTLAGIEFHVGDAAVTRRACLADIMQREQNFLRVLARAKTVRLDGHALALRDSNGAVILEAVREVVD